MGEIVVSFLLKAVFEKLASEPLQNLIRSQGIHSEIQNLRRTLLHIQDHLTDASEREITDKGVQRWLNGLQHLAYDIEDVLDDLNTKAMRRELEEELGSVTRKVRKLIPTCCSNFTLSNRLRHKLDSIATQLQDLEKDRLTLGLNIVRDLRIKSVRRTNETSLPDASRIVGREDDKTKLIHKLLDDEPCKENFSIVPIVGLGGVGKTTLARLLYNEPEVSDRFEFKAWVCVSYKFDIVKITKSIIQAVTRKNKREKNNENDNENKELGDLNQLQLALMEQLKDKRFLIVLDDLWSEEYVEWENLVKPFHSGAPGSKVIITTRTEQLLKKLGFDHLEHLKCLSDDKDVVSLFAQHALGEDNFDSHPTLKPHGEGIVKKCGGLPLALKALGTLLRTKTEEEDWTDVLNSEIWGLENDGIIPALRLSYHDLPGCLKQMFAYCSLFPKNFLFDKEDLVLLWMAEGFLNQSTANKSAERVGHESFEKLLSRSFFQRAPNEESLYVMHDLMNDLATFVAGDFFLRFNNKMETDKEALGKYRHIAFIRDKYVAYRKFEVFERAKSLRTLLAMSIGVKKNWDHFYLSNKILVDLIPELSLLRVLSLSGFDIKEVPEVIGSLKHLRYLNLSQTQIVVLPENVGNLYNLQSLIVFGCRKLSKLPYSFLKLKKLRHFDFRDTQLLNKMPLEIGGLKNLQTLTKIIIGGDDGLVITELKDLNNLHGFISIERLDKVQNARHAWEANLSEKRLTGVNLQWVDEFDCFRDETLEFDVLNKLTPSSDSLINLGIIFYGGIEFPKWVGDPLFERLVSVSISGCRKCTSLPPLGKLRSLKALEIENMNELKVIGAELLGTNGVAFPKLETLSFLHMKGWEVWSVNGGSNAMFPCLRELYIYFCPNLIKVSMQALPLLKDLAVVGCRHMVLRSVVQVASSITNLGVHDVSGLTYNEWRGIMEYLGSVENILIRLCNEITYMWESEAQASKVLTNLRKLEVMFCDSFVSLGEKEESDCGSGLLTSLTMLMFWHCKSMERCMCPNSVEMLSIYFCPSMTVVFFPTSRGGGWKTLKSLTINNCEKLLEKKLGGEKINNVSMPMPMLEEVRITGWPNLKSILELNYSIHLTQLIIQDCESIDSFPDLLLLSLTSIKHLEIKNCPNMDASFLCQNWPPKLCILKVGRLKKPISEMGLQNFPTSLVELELFGENVSNFSQVSDLLPPSLTSFGINEFTELESLSMGLEHLTSLEHLSIIKCPKMKHLPQMLLPSLLSLKISGCVHLEERTSKKGSYYWPLVSHIPCVEIKSDED